jgi:hypothetical protein
MDLEQIWAEELPEIRKGVTGVGIWSALNACKPVALEDGTLVVGLRPEDSELVGHLKLPQTRAVIERTISERLGHPVTLRVIDGTTLQDWEAVKRKEAQARRIQDRAHAKYQAEASARTNWEHVYEQVNRLYSAAPNRSLPQSRAAFFFEAVEIVVQARSAQGTLDELGERNYARCLERIAQYAGLPSTFVAIEVARRVAKA